METLRAWWAGQRYALELARRYTPGRFRWRSRARMYTPWWLLDRGLFAKPARDCGAHDWYNHDGQQARCGHCEVGRGPWPPVPTGDPTDQR